VLVYIKHTVDINPFKATALICDVNNRQIWAYLLGEGRFVHAQVFMGVFYPDNAWTKTKLLSLV
jgi:hypothetical protein